MLDNGDGPRSHSDYSHHCCLHRAACLPSKVTHMVVAKGETEFGVFISVGILEEIDDTGPDSCREHKLTLSRRYVISDRDPRFRSSLERRAVSDSIYLPRPWENLPLRQRVVGNSDADNRSSKRKRGDES